MIQHFPLACMPSIFHDFHIQPLLSASFLTSSLSWLYLTALLLLWRLTRRFRRSTALVNGPAAPSWLTGHLRQLVGKDALQFHDGLMSSYNEAGAIKLKGYFGSDELYISDPLAIKHIMNDVDQYPQTEEWTLRTKMMFGPNIFSATGYDHTKQRKMITSTFSKTNLNILTPVFHEVSHRLCDLIKSEISRQDSQQADVQIMGWLTRAALAAIGDGCLGINLNTMEDTPNPYCRAMERMQLSLSPLRHLFPLQPLLSKIGSSAFQARMVELLPFQAPKNLKRVLDDLDDITTEMYNTKKREMESDPSSFSGKADIISRMMQENASSTAHARLTDKEIVSQIGALTFAGNETTASTMSTMLWLLALHPDWQDQVRCEIMSAMNEHGQRDLNSTQLEGLPIMDAIVKETLRWCSPATMISRISKEDSVIPLLRPITARDGVSQITELPVEKGTRMYIAMRGVNRAKVNWGPDARAWNPARWLGGNSTYGGCSVKLPGVFPGQLSFSSGERSCVGWRFAVLNLRVLLFSMVQSFSFEPIPDLDIDWIYGVISVPTVKGQVGLPLKVTVIPPGSMS